MKSSAWRAWLERAARGSLGPCLAFCRWKGDRSQSEGRSIRVRSPRDAIAAGICLVPEDRKAQGLLLQWSIEKNIALPWLPRLGRWGLLNRRAERGLADRQAAALDIRAASLEQRVVQLSGGNQQKVVLARWLAMEPRVLILDEPTRGIDAGAKAEIYQWMARLAARGVGMLVVSSDLEEVIAVSDRVLVMHDGRLCGELAGDAITEEAVMRLAIGNP